jgi:hypothetical protein
MSLFHFSLHAQSQEKGFSAGLHLNTISEGLWIQPTLGYQFNDFLSAQAGFGLKPISPLLGDRSFRVGILGEVLEVKRFSFHLGAHYFIARRDLSEFAGRNAIKKGYRFELSGNVFYRINSHFTIQLAVPVSLFTEWSDDNQGRDRKMYENLGLNLGCNYHF